MGIRYIPLLLVIACVSFYTMSYGLWTWRKKNRPGAIMIFFLALATLALPIYGLFFRS